MEALRELRQKVSKNALKFGNSLGLVKTLSDLQKNKLIYEFNTFFDVNSVGSLERKDFDLLQQNICNNTGWAEGSEKHKLINELFVELWRKLSTGDAIPEKPETEEVKPDNETKTQNEAETQNETKTQNEDDIQNQIEGGLESEAQSQTEAPTQNEGQTQIETEIKAVNGDIKSDNEINGDGEVKQEVENEAPMDVQEPVTDGDAKVENEGEGQEEVKDIVVTSEDWLKIWENFLTDGVKKDETDGHDILPNWLEQYIQFKFNLFDRSGDGLVDLEEFEYVLGGYGVSCKEARTCFMLISKQYTVKIDLEYFKELFLEYVQSKDAGAAGNFVAGKVDFSEL